MVRHYVAKRSRSGKGPDWLIMFYETKPIWLSNGQAPGGKTKPIREEPGLADYLFYETKPIWLSDGQAPGGKTKPIREEPGLPDYLFYETKPIRGGPDWLIALFTKRSQFGLDCLIPCSKVFNYQTRGAPQLRQPLRKNKPR